MNDTTLKIADDWKNQRQAVAYGLDEITTERLRQVTHHQWTPKNDDRYTQDELKLYAYYWLTPEEAEDQRQEVKRQLQQIAEEFGHRLDWNDRWFQYDERTPVERLARAGALIAAEIDRVNRLTVTTINHE